MSLSFGSIFDYCEEKTLLDKQCTHLWVYRLQLLSLLMFQEKELQELDTISCEIYDEYNKHSGNTTKSSGVAAEAAELQGCVDGACSSSYSSCLCFPIQDSVYSLFSLFEDQALKLVGVPMVVLSCSGLGLPTLLF